MASSLFPHEQIRNVQKECMDAVAEAIASKSHLIVHAPTGLGKTAAALAPALAFGMEHDKTVFFLTSRHTQHRIAIDTLRKIKEKSGKKIPAADMIGKKWMCSQEHAAKLSTSDFTEYCKKLREDGQCTYYNNTRTENKLTKLATQVLHSLIDQSPMHTEDLMHEAKKDELCSYELVLPLASSSNVIVADYYYIFHPKVSDHFFAKTGKKLEEAILIIDEGHNLPDRIRDLLSLRLTSFMLKRAIKEAKQHQFPEVMEHIVRLQEVLLQLAEDVKSQKQVSHDDFFNKVSAVAEYETLIEDITFAGDTVLAAQRQSSLRSVASFLEGWQGQDDGFLRYIESSSFHGEPSTTLTYACLDPNIVAGAIIAKTHATILMSGTLHPPEMYRDLLGFPKNTTLKVFESPFPKNNKLTLVIPKTTTRYEERSPAQFKEIGGIVSSLAENIPGNVAVFFPSYPLRDLVYPYMQDCKKTIFQEQMQMTKQEKAEFLENFKSYRKTGAALLGVMGANFAEGIDLPGDFLNGVVIVGLPLQPPDIVIKALIDYYDRKFGKGWDYGYLFPAFNKTLQGAGRCIRSETDRGVVVFLDKRYTWPRYFRCFPQEMDLAIKQDFIGSIAEFFKRDSK
ncbi:ATP-dependent DNA helicase [Candidatus Woesearchaeota archaeon]|nr:ATP-dependent DNA helicase [Candidatus Woesearchaeota archaeon]